MPVHPETLRDRYKNDPEYRRHRLALKRAWREANREKVKIQEKDSKQRQRLKDPEKFQATRTRRQRERRRLLQETNPEILRERQRRFLTRKSPEWHAQRTANRRALREAKKSASASGRPRPDKCDICGGNRIRIVFDHCHDTGKFRGWICSPCNVVLGLMNDDPILLRKLADYLENPPT